MKMPMGFAGSKLLLFVGEKLVVLLRDDKPDIPFPGYWDFPGGGRENNESPKACALRETEEEIAVALHEEDLIWAREFVREGIPSWMFAAHLPSEAATALRLGDEGQALELMSPAEYLAHPKAIPRFQDRLRVYLAERGPQESPPP